MEKKRGEKKHTTRNFAPRIRAATGFRAFLYHAFLHHAFLYNITLFCIARFLYHAFLHHARRTEQEVLLPDPSTSTLKSSVSRILCMPRIDFDMRGNDSLIDYVGKVVLSPQNLECD